MKKLGLGPKMILSFLVAIAGSVVICGVITYSRTKNVLNSNMQLTSEQTLESALNSLQTYEKTISLPVDLLTRKTSIKQLEYEDQFDDYIANVQDGGVQGNAGSGAKLLCDVQRKTHHRMGEVRGQR